MEMRYLPNQPTLRYRVQLGEPHEPTWYFPSCIHNDGEHASLSWQHHCYAVDPPSAELRSLIEAGAPWYAVMDKLSEEYPQWQHHFDEAIRRHWAEQPTSDSQPQEGEKCQ